MSESMAVMLVTLLNCTWNHAPFGHHVAQYPLLFRRPWFAGPVSATLAFKAESGMERSCSPRGEVHSRDITEIYVITDGKVRT